MKIYLINMPFYEQEYTKFTEKWEYIEDEYVGINIVQTILEENDCEVILNKENSIIGMINEVNNKNSNIELKLINGYELTRSVRNFNDYCFKEDLINEV